jgi:hypothetical protein
VEGSTQPKIVSLPGGTPSYRPEYLWAPGRHQTTFAYVAKTLRGGMLHSSRGGKRDRRAEYEATVGWAQNPANPLLWDATIGEDVVAEHTVAGRGGWSAYDASLYYPAAEFAEGLLGQGITDRQVHAYCWWWVERQLVELPSTPPLFKSHADVEHSWENGRGPTGKTDTHPFGSAGAAELKERIADRLWRYYGVEARAAA